MSENMIIGNIDVLQSSESITEELYRRFIAYIDAKPKTIEVYTRAIRQFAGYLTENNIDKPVREDILAFRSYLKETGHKPATIQNYITVTRRFFQWTAQEGIYPDVAEHVKGAVIGREHKKDYLTGKQAKAVLENVDCSELKGIRDYAILLLMITGGLRNIEVVRANIEDMRTVGNDTVLFIQGKGRDEKGEYVKITIETEVAIREYLKARDNINPEQPLFVSMSNNSKGKRLSTRTVSGIVKSRLRAAGFDSDRLTAHSLRHTAVTLSLLGGESLQSVQQFARHGNLNTTMIYAHNLERAENTCESTIAKSIFTEDD